MTQQELLTNWPRATSWFTPDQFKLNLGSRVISSTKSSDLLLISTSTYSTSTVVPTQQTWGWNCEAQKLGSNLSKKRAKRERSFLTVNWSQWVHLAPSKAKHACSAPKQTKKTHRLCSSPDVMKHGHSDAHFLKCFVLATLSFSFGETYKHTFFHTAHKQGASWRQRRWWHVMQAPWGVIWLPLDNNIGLIRIIRTGFRGTRPHSISNWRREEFLRKGRCYSGSRQLLNE